MQKHHPCLDLLRACINAAAGWCLQLVRSNIPTPPSLCHGFANPVSTSHVLNDLIWVWFQLIDLHFANDKRCKSPVLWVCCYRLWSSHQNINPIPHPSLLPGTANTAKTWTAHQTTFFDQKKLTRHRMKWILHNHKSHSKSNLPATDPENFAPFVCFMPQTKNVNCALFRAMQTQPFLRTRPEYKPGRIAAAHGHMHVTR